MMRIERYNNDCICWDCGGINYCFCLCKELSIDFRELPDPICRCGKLAVTCGSSCVKEE